MCMEGRAGVHYEIRHFPLLADADGGEAVADDDSRFPVTFGTEEEARLWLARYLMRHNIDGGAEERYAVARVDVRVLGPRLVRRRPRESPVRGR